MNNESQAMDGLNDGNENENERINNSGGISLSPLGTPPPPSPPPLRIEEESIGMRVILGSSDTMPQEGCHISPEAETVDDRKDDDEKEEENKEEKNQTTDTLTHHSILLLLGGEERQTEKKDEDSKTAPVPTPAEVNPLKDMIAVEVSSRSSRSSSSSSSSSSSDQRQPRKRTPAHPSAEVQADGVQWTPCKDSSKFGKARYRHTLGVLCTYCTYTACARCYKDLPIYNAQRNAGQQQQQQREKLKHQRGAALKGSPLDLSGNERLILGDGDGSEETSHDAPHIPLAPIGNEEREKENEKNENEEGNGLQDIEEDNEDEASLLASGGGGGEGQEGNGTVNNSERHGEALRPPLHSLSTACHLCGRGPLIRNEVLLHEWVCEGPLPARRVRRASVIAFDSDVIARYYALREQRERRAASTLPLRGYLVMTTTTSSEGEEEEKEKEENEKRKSGESKCIATESAYDAFRVEALDADSNNDNDDGDGERASNQDIPTQGGVNAKRKRQTANQKLRDAIRVNRQIRSGNAVPNVSRRATPCCDEGRSFVYAVHNPRLTERCVWCVVNRIPRNTHPIAVQIHDNLKGVYTNAGNRCDWSENITPIALWNCPPSLPNVEDKLFEFHIPLGCFDLLDVHAVALYRAEDVYAQRAPPGCNNGSTVNGNESEQPLMGTTAASGNQRSKHRIHHNTSNGSSPYAGELFGGPLTAESLSQLDSHQQQRQNNNKKKKTTNKNTREGKLAVTPVGRWRGRHNRRGYGADPFSVTDFGYGGGVGGGGYAVRGQPLLVVDVLHGIASPCPVPISLLSPAMRGLTSMLPEVQWRWRSLELLRALDYVVQGRSVAVHSVGSPRFFLYLVSHAKELKGFNVTVMDGGDVDSASRRQTSEYGNGGNVSTSIVSQLRRLERRLQSDGVYSAAHRLEAVYGHSGGGDAYLGENSNPVSTAVGREGEGEGEGEEMQPCNAALRYRHLLNLSSTAAHNTSIGMSNNSNNVGAIPYHSEGGRGGGGGNDDDDDNKDNMTGAFDLSFPGVRVTRATHTTTRDYGADNNIVITDNDIRASTTHSAADFERIAASAPPHSPNFFMSSNAMNESLARTRQHSLLQQQDNQNNHTRGDGDPLRKGKVMRVEESRTEKVPPQCTSSSSLWPAPPRCVPWTHESELLLLYGKRNESSSSQNVLRPMPPSLEQLIHAEDTIHRLVNSNLERINNSNNNNNTAAGVGGGSICSTQSVPSSSIPHVALPKHDVLQSDDSPSPGASHLLVIHNCDKLDRAAMVRLEALIQRNTAPSTLSQLTLSNNSIPFPPPPPPFQSSSPSSPGAANGTNVATNIAMNNNNTNSSTMGGSTPRVLSRCKCRPSRLVVLCSFEDPLWFTRSSASYARTTSSGGGVGVGCEDADGPGRGGGTYSTVLSNVGAIEDESASSGSGSATTFFSTLNFAVLELGQYASYSPWNHHHHHHRSNNDSMGGGGGGEYKMAKPLEGQNSIRNSKPKSYWFPSTTSERALSDSSALLALLPRVVEANGLSALSLNLHYEPQLGREIPSWSFPGNTGRGEGDDDDGRREDGRTDPHKQQQHSLRYASIPTHDTVRRVLQSLSPYHRDLLLIMLHVQECVGEGEFVPIQAFLNEFGGDGPLLSSLRQQNNNNTNTNNSSNNSIIHQERDNKSGRSGAVRSGINSIISIPCVRNVTMGRMRAIQNELTSNRLAIFDSSQFKLLLPQPRKVRQILADLQPGIQSK